MGKGMSDTAQAIFVLVQRRVCNVDSIWTLFDFDGRLVFPLHPRSRLPMSLKSAIVPALVLAALSAAQAHAQQQAPSSILRVHVTDDQGRPLPQAHVTVGGVPGGAITNDRGDARMNAVPPGNRIVLVSRVGYAFGRVAADFTGDTVVKTFTLTPQPIELEGITVTSWGRSMRLRQNGYYDRQRQGLGAFMTKDRIDEMRPSRVSNLFRYMRGFTVVPGPGTSEYVVTSRGRRCLPQVYVDGMLSARTARDQRDVLEMVLPGDVEAIEAYSSAAEIPAQYNGSNSMCGVIVIWTRHGEPPPERSSN